MYPFTKHRKFFSSHLALPLFVNNKFIELQTGGYFVCTRPDLTPSVTSAQPPPHLRHLYHQVVEFSHATLPVVWTSSTRIWTSVMSIVSEALRCHGMHSQESSPGRLRPSVSLRGCSHFMSVSCSISALSPPRDIQLARAVQTQVLPVTSLCRQSALLTQLLHQESRESSRPLVRPSLHWLTQSGG